jgi:FtsH-binding integral membrane protein
MSTFSETRAAYDEGLRQFMINMYNHTAAGLAVSGLVAYLTYASGALFAMGSLMWLFVFAPLGMIIWYSFAGQNWSYSTLQTFYYTFVALMGVSLSTIFAVYTALSIAQVFFITAATFGSASLYGYSTKRDLTGFGSFLIMGLIGIIIASIVNLFLASSALMFTISILGVLIFTGLTAWDTQNAKNIYLTHGGDPRFGIQFAISLYLNFINLFQMLLHLLGNRE